MRNILKLTTDITIYAANFTFHRAVFDKSDQAFTNACLPIVFLPHFHVFS